MSTFDREAVAAEIQSLGDLLMQNLETRETEKTTGLFNKHNLVVTSDTFYTDDYDFLMQAWNEGNAGITEIKVNRIEARKVQVLSERHGIFTVKFYETMVQNGETQVKEVVWTLVFEKENGEWTIINTAGAHVVIPELPEE